MKFVEAVRIISLGERPKGYRISFEEKDGSILRSDYFPDVGEPLIPTESEAWELAELFARNTVGKYVNIYVVDDNNRPVSGYQDRTIENRTNSLSKEAQRSTAI